MIYDVSDSEVSYNTIITSASGGSNVIWSSELSNLTDLVFTYNTVDYSGGSQVAFLTDFISEGLSKITDTTATTVTTVTVNGNTFSNWGARGLRIGVDVTAVTVSYNQFLGAGESLKNEDATVVIAENNWWGDADPSDDVDGNVDYDPWYMDSGLTFLASDSIEA